MLPLAPFFSLKPKPEPKPESMLRPTSLLGLALVIVGIVAIAAVSQNFLTPRAQILPEDLPPKLYPIFSEETESGTTISIAIDKQLSGKEVTAGNALTVVLSLENTGDLPLTNLTLEERLDTSQLSITSSGGTLTQNRLLWNIPLLKPGQKWWTRYKAEVNDDVTPGIIESTAYVFGEEINDLSSSSRMASGLLEVVELPVTGVELLN